MQCLAVLQRVRHIAAVLGVLCAVMSAPAAQAGNLDLTTYRGKVVMLDFWASWCNPCRQSFPWMSSMVETYGDKGLVVIAVNVDHERQLADDFLQDNPANFKIVYDPNGEIARQFHFKDMPTSYLIGRNGKVRFVHPGFYAEREGEYAAQMRTLLNEPVQK